MRARRQTLAGLFMAFAPVLLQAQGGGPALGPEFQINTETANDQLGGGIDHDAAGDFVAVWNWGDTLPRGQRFDASGNKIGEEFALNAAQVFSLNLAEVAMSAAGEFVVAWDAEGADGSQLDTFVRRFNSAGLPDSDEFEPHASTSGYQTNIAVAMADDGSFVAAWTHYESPTFSREVHVRLFDSNSMPLGDEFQVNEFTEGSQRAPELAMDAAGNFVVVWESGGDQDGSGRGIFARRYDAAGTPLGGEFQVNSTTEGEQMVPDVGMSASGNFVVSWWGDADGSLSREVLAQRFDAAGAPKGSEFRVNSTLEGDQKFPRVDQAASGEFVIGWNSSEGSSITADVFARRYNAIGQPVGEEFRVNSSIFDGQYISGVSMSDEGRFVVTWTDITGLDGDGLGVFGQRFAPGVFADGFESGDISAWSASVP